MATPPRIDSVREEALKVPSYVEPKEEHPSVGGAIIMTPMHYQTLGEAPGVCVFERAAPAALGRLRRQLGPQLPEDLLQLLSESNGAVGFHGYLRLFGAPGTPVIDSVVWNQASCWKFAWGERLARFWCFAETGWGDQYALAIDSRGHVTSSEIFLLDAYAMTPTRIAESFAEFLQDEFIRCAHSPYDINTRKVWERLGELRTSDHVVYLPSPLLGGEESPENAIAMPSREAMIVNGDIAVQLDTAPESSTVVGITSYEDEEQRTRIKLVFQ